MKTKSALLLSALLATTAHAAESGWYVLGSIGQGKYDSSKSDFDDALRGTGVAVSSSSQDNSDSGYKVQVGYQFTPNFAVEGGYLNFGETTYKANGNRGSFNVQAKSKTEIDGWNVSALGMLPLGDFSLFAKVGLIAATADSKATVSVGSTSVTVSDDDSKTKPLLGLGAGYAFNEHIGIRVEWERLVNSGSSNDDDDDAGDIDLFSAGLIYKF